MTSVTVRTMFVLVLLASMASAQLPLRFFDFGAQADDLYGRSVSAAGDVNGDGIPDFIVGAIGDDTGGTNAGAAHVLSGVDGAILYSFYGTGPDDQFGSAVAGAGDVNNDGFADVVVGAFHDDDGGLDAGSATVFSGADGTIFYKIDGLAANDNFGIAAAGVGDLNNDQHDDFIVGAWLSDANGTDSGAVRIFSGFDGSPLYTFVGDDPGDQLGISVAKAGDVNNDGTPDVIVGAILDDNGGGNAGMARVFSGSDGTTLHTFYGSAAGDLFGISVDGTGDIDGDGFDDLIVGAFLADSNGTDSGQAVVFSGFDGSILHNLAGNPGSQLGFAVAGCGDVNGDTVPDLLCGAPKDSSVLFQAGRASWYSGVDGALIRSFDGISVNNQLGTALSGLGDTNQDGFAESILGNPFTDVTGFNAGGWSVISLGGTREYVGSPSPFVSLTLKWQPDANPAAYTGFVTCTGAVPGGLGLSAVSLAPDDALVFGGFPLYVAANPIDLQGTLSFGFDSSGSHTSPLTIKSPFTAGVVFFVQYFQTTPVPAASNGLEILIVE